MREISERLRTLAESFRACILNKEVDVELARNLHHSLQETISDDLHGAFYGSLTDKDKLFYIVQQKSNRSKSSAHLFVNPKIKISKTLIGRYVLLQLLNQSGEPVFAWGIVSDLTGDGDLIVKISRHSKYAECFKGQVIRTERINVLRVEKEAIALR